MKIAIPVDKNEIGTDIAASFGRAPYFLIYDTETKEGKFLDNSAAASTGGAGIRAAQIVVGNAADALLTPRCGQNAADVLKAADIKLYKTEGSSSEKNIEKFVAAELPLLTEIHAGFHGHGGN